MYFINFLYKQATVKTLIIGPLTFSLEGGNFPSPAHDRNPVGFHCYLFNS